MWRTSFAQRGFGSARLRVAEPTDLGVLVDAESFKVAVAFHLAGSHNATHSPEALLYRQDCGDRTRRFSFGVLPVSLSAALPCAVQVGERDKPALKTIPAPKPSCKNEVRDTVRRGDNRDESEHVKKIPKVKPLDQGGQEKYDRGEAGKQVEKGLYVQILHGQSSNPI